MVAPGSLGSNFEVMLEFSLDPEAQDRVQKRVSTIQEELARIEKQAKQSGAAINQAMQAADKKGDAAQKSVTKLGAELARLGERAKSSSKQVNDGLDSNIRKFKQLEEAAKRARSQATLISEAASRASSHFVQGLAVGGLVAGGILGEANRYAKEVEGTRKATEATREWVRTTQELAVARGRVDQVLLREALPLLQQAAKVAEKAADFIEKHPELVRATLNLSAAAVAVNAIGLAVTRGIKLVADARYLAAVATELLAARLHEKAARDELLAAGSRQVTNRADDLRKVLGIGSTGGLGAGIGGTLAGAITSPAGAAALIASYAALSVSLSKTMTEIDRSIYTFAAKTKANATLVSTATFLLHAAEQTMAPLAYALKNFRDAAARDIPLIVQLVQRLTGATDQAAGGSGRGSVGGRQPSRTTTDPTKQQALQMYIDYREADLALVQDHYRQRQGIIEDANAAELASEKSYADARSKVGANLTKSLAAAAADFDRANERAEQQYFTQRSQIVRDGNAEIERIERESKERLAKLEQDHLDRRADAIARRDALALSKEDRDFARAVDDEKSQAQREIKDRRQAIAQRLADLQASYEQERAQRLADYQARVAELRANAADQLKELAAQHAEELARIREQKAAKLKELDAQLAAERQRRYQYYVQQIKDLNAALIGMSDIQKRYQNQMLIDFEGWLSRMQAQTAGLTTSTGTTGGALGDHDWTGYAYPGLYKMANNGQREFVLSGQDTKIAEKIIGSQLTSTNLLGALQLIGGNRQMNYVDQRRIDQPVSKWSKREMEKIAIGAMTKAMKGTA